MGCCIYLKHLPTNHAMPRFSFHHCRSEFALSDQAEAAVLISGKADETRKIYPGSLENHISDVN